MKDHTLLAIYNLFKPMKETCVWASASGDGELAEVCVHWQHVDGHMRWAKLPDGTLEFNYLREGEQP